MRKIKILVVANVEWPTLIQKVEEVKRWFNRFDLTFDIEQTRYPLIPLVLYEPTEHKNPYGVDPNWFNKYITIQAIGHDIVLLLMSQDHNKPGNSVMGWRTDNNEGVVELQVWADEHEKIIYPNGDVIDAFFERVRHELLHALFMLSGGRDVTHQMTPENALKEVYFDSPRETDETLSLLKKYAFLLLTLLGLKRQARERGIPIGESLLPIPLEPPAAPPPPIPAHVPLLDKWALAIQKHEGWFPGSRSYRNQNPGNLKWVGQRRATGKDKDNFCIFPTYEAGYQTLKDMLYNAATGKSKVYKPDMSLFDFFKIFAPHYDHNQPDIYARWVAVQLKVEPTTPIKNLV